MDPHASTGNQCRVTPRGVVTLVVSVLLVLAGFAYGLPGIMLVGFTGLLLLAVSFPLARKNLAGLTMERKTPESAYAGQEFPLEFSVANPRRWDAWSVDYEESVAGPAEKGLSASWIKGGGQVLRKCPARMLRRGVRHRARAAVESTFPMGLWKVRREQKDVVDMLVYPRPITPRILEDPEFLNMLESDDAESLQYDNSGDFHGIREFQPGDRVKHIDWATTARAGKIMVSVFDKRLPSRYMVIFHSASAKGRSQGGDAFESAIELLCGLLTFAQDRLVPVDFYASFNDWQNFQINLSPDAYHKALRMLATARRSPENDLRPLAGILAQVSSTARVFILSDVAVREWESVVPDAPCLVTCLSVSDLRLKQPRIYRRELSEQTAQAAPVLPGERGK